MIAPQRIEREPARRAPARRERVAPRRKRRARPRLHVPGVAAIALAVLVVVPLLPYVMLSANLTSLSYAIAGEQRQRAALIEETQRLDDRISRLTSPDRLAALAAQLRMHDPHVYAVVALPRPAPTPMPHGFALLGWFGQR